jgi:long-chain acyl-CoA synthetase
VATERTQRPAWIIGRLARQVELAASSVDLTLSQYRVLVMLGEGSETASVLADKLAVGRPSLTGVIDVLVQRGLVQRDSDANDRRRISLALTAPGEAVLATADAEIERRLHEIASYCPEGPEAAIGGLQPWLHALDAYRAARRAGAAACPQAATAQPATPGPRP